MTEISDSVRLLFETSLEKTDDGYVVPIPTELVENGSLSAEETYRIALLATNAPPQPESSETGTKSPGESSQSGDATVDSSTRPSSQSDSPPVEEGEIRTVTIDTLGDQGDGIAKVERGFIVIVPGTQPGDRVEVKITDVRETVAFAEPVSEATVL